MQGFNGPHILKLSYCEVFCVDIADIGDANCLHIKNILQEIVEKLFLSRKFFEMTALEDEEFLRTFIMLFGSATIVSVNRIFCQSALTLILVAIRVLQ